MRVAAVNAGLPFDNAFSADDGFVWAWIVAHAANNGKSYNWDTKQWDPDK